MGRTRRHLRSVQRRLPPWRFSIASLTHCDRVLPLDESGLPCVELVAEGLPRQPTLIALENVDPETLQVRLGVHLDGGCRTQFPGALTRVRVHVIALLEIVRVPGQYRRYVMLVRELKQGRHGLRSQRL